MEFDNTSKNADAYAFDRAADHLDGILTKDSPQRPHQKTIW